MNRLFELAQKPISNAVLIVFRVAFGFVIFTECLGGVALGMVKQYFVEPEFVFTFSGFEFLSVLHGSWMNFYFVLMGVLGFCMMVGYRYRLIMPVLSIMWTAFLFSHKSAYQNHFYLNMLFLWLFTFFSAHKRFSVDVVKGRVLEQKSMAIGVKWVFVFQIFCFYFYATISKFYPDWLDGTTTNVYFISKHDWYILGELFQERLFHLFIAYSGILFDGTIVFFLLWKKTRKYAFIASILFHGTNQLLFGLGMLPFLSISLCVFFFDADWFEEKLFKNLSYNALKIPVEKVRLSKTLLWSLVVYCVFQFGFPARHYIIPQDVLLTEEGHRFSWRMKLRAKPGVTVYELRNEKGRLLRNVLALKHFSRRQSSFLGFDPQMIRRSAFMIRDKFQPLYKDEKLSVYARNSFRVNNKRERYRLFSPKLDLLTTDWTSFGHNEWVNPELIK